MLRTIDYSSTPLPKDKLRAVITQELISTRATSIPCYIRLEHSPIRSILSDLDGTLIPIELMPLLAEELGLGEEMNRLTQKAMQGEVDFETSFRLRTNMLSGLPISTLHHLAINLPLPQGVIEAIDWLRQRGINIGIASGAYRGLVAPIAERLGISNYIASYPQEQDGVLTGAFESTIVQPSDKAHFLHQRSKELGIPTSHFLTIGDGANDLEMFLSSGHILLYSNREDPYSPPLIDIVKQLLPL